MIIRRLCVLLNAERVYRELSTILEAESDLDFASIMVQVGCDFSEKLNKDLLYTPDLYCSLSMTYLKKKKSNETLA